MACERLPLNLLLQLSRFRSQLRPFCLCAVTLPICTSDMPSHAHLLVRIEYTLAAIA